MTSDWEVKEEAAALFPLRFEGGPDVFLPLFGRR